VGHRTAAEGHRVLILAPFGRDGESVSQLLAREGYDTKVCASITEVAESVDEHVGAILMTEEALNGDQQPLRDVLVKQPAWSDVPFVLLAAPKAMQSPTTEMSRLKLFDLSTNSLVLERPLGRASLVSAVASALRSRQRQFEMRDRIVELRDNEAKFQAIANSIDQMIWTTLPDGYHDYYNNRWYEFTGVPYGTTDGEGWNDVFHPEDQERAWSRWQHSLDTGEPYEIEYRLRHRSGEYRWVLGRAQPLRDTDGRIVRWFGTCTVIHDLVAAREVLARSREDLEHMVEARTAALEAEMASRSRAEAALRQSQKMEAVGQLTGGIAHDFNNMLTGVIGGIDIVRRRLAAGRMDDIDRFLNAASASANRAAALTARLLAFSRRQSLDSRPFDVNQMLTSLEELLRRTIGENIAIEIVTSPQQPIAAADENQLENAILNLAINARDAMPDGGRLTIETSVVDLDHAYAQTRPDIKPGRYVMVAVSDTGVGMPPEILEKVFDPFFTTKPIGQGTGLGLSMVYGFAQQSGGQVRVHSRPGDGTSVKIYLPASNLPAETQEAAPGPVEAENLGGTVLLVEDDEAVRMLVREVLSELHFMVVEADRADAAVPILASDRTIDLMISDVGLPGMNGRQLAEIARQHRPHLPVLFVTGYAENAAIRSGFLGTNMAMVTKPFSLETLSGKIQDMLAAQAKDGAAK
jgi:PAS domain S-box-containing protein